MAGSPILPWLAAIMTTRPGKEPVPLCEDDNVETLRKIECRSNMRSNTDTILFQVKTFSQHLTALTLGLTLSGETGHGQGSLGDDVLPGLHTGWDHPLLQPPTLDIENGCSYVDEKSAIELCRGVLHCDLVNYLPLLFATNSLMSQFLVK